MYICHETGYALLGCVDIVVDVSGETLLIKLVLVCVLGVHACPLVSDVGVCISHIYTCLHMMHVYKLTRNVTINTHVHMMLVHNLPHNLLSQSTVIVSAFQVTVKPLPNEVTARIARGGEAFAWWAACMDLEKPEPFAETITEGLGEGRWVR